MCGPVALEPFTLQFPDQNTIDQLPRIPDVIPCLPASDNNVHPVGQKTD